MPTNSARTTERASVELANFATSFRVPASSGAFGRAPPMDVPWRSASSRSSCSASPRSTRSAASERSASEAPPTSRDTYREDETWKSRPPIRSEPESSRQSSSSGSAASSGPSRRAAITRRPQASGDASRSTPAMASPGNGSIAPARSGSSGTCGGEASGRASQERA